MPGSSLAALRSGAVGVISTLYAATAVLRAEGPDRGAIAFAVLVALIASTAALVAAVGSAGAIAFDLADWQAVVGERITTVPRRAVTGRKAGHAAVFIGVAAGKRGHTVGVGSTGHARGFETV